MSEPGKYVGLIAAFYPSPGAVKNCMELNGAKRHVGAVVGTKPNGTTQRGAIPDTLLTIRGKSGRTVTVSLVESYAQLFPTWHEAASVSQP